MMNSDLTTPVSAARTIGKPRHWWMLWAGFLLVMVALTVLHAPLPTDGFSGDLESFAIENGFLLRFRGDTRSNDLQPGDIVRRIDGYDINTWLSGNVRPGQHWFQGGTARYEIERNNTLLTLEVPLSPSSVFDGIMAWLPRAFVMLSFFSIGTFVLYRRPHDGDARRLMLFSMAVATAFYADTYNFRVNSIVLQYPLLIQVAVEHIFYGMQFITAAHFSMMFPAPFALWTRYPRLAPLALWLIYLVPIALAMILAPTPRDMLVQGNRASIFGSLLAQMLVIYAYVRNLKRISDPVQRSQAKWILWSAILAGMLVFPLYFLPLITNVGQLTAPDLSVFLLGLIPASFAIAILRYRLFSIDLVINRSLVYGLALAGLAILLAALFELLQRTFGLDTLPLMALMFIIGIVLVSPALRLTQHLVDRYIYQFRFDLNELERAHNKQPVIEKPGVYTGLTLGGYELRDVIGTGGMGEIYSGHQGKQRIAIKILLPALALDVAAVTQFEREAIAMQHLQHPAIPAFYGHGKSDDLGYLLMEYLEGQDLKTYLREQERISLNDACDMMAQLADALDYIHQQGIVHRDLKPANIMLQPNPDQKTYRVRLLDFGLAQLPSHERGETGEGAVGTINYMSPEQIQGQKTIDHRADIYALGVILYQMLTGEMPYTGGLASVLFAHLNQPVPDIRDVLPELPYDVSWAIMRAMSKDADDRPDSANEFMQILMGG